MQPYTADPALDRASESPSPPSGERGSGLTPVSLFLVLLIGYLIIKVQLVLILLILALLFATVIERPVNELEKRHVPRGLSILAVYIAILGTIVLAAILVAPQISHEADVFRREAPAQLRDLQDSWRTSDISLLRGAGVRGLDRAIKAINDPPSLSQDTAIGLVTGVGGGVIGAITVFVMAFYYLLEKQLIRRLIVIQLRPKARERVNRVWDNVEAQVGRWVRGQLLLCCVIGGASLIGYGAMGIRFWPLLGIFAGITEAIPIAGPWIGGVPAVVVALTQSWQQAIAVALFVVVLQACENWFLVPRVMRGAVGLTPLTVFVAILTGSQFMSVLGAFLAIPVAAVVQVIISDFMRTRREANKLPEPQGTGWRWMREQIQHELLHDEPPEQHRETNGGTTPSWSSTTLAKAGSRTNRQLNAVESASSESEESTPAIPKK